MDESTLKQIKDGVDSINKRLDDPINGLAAINRRLDDPESGLESIKSTLDTHTASLMQLERNIGIYEEKSDRNNKLNIAIFKV
jgi:hypothetical protein